MTSEKRFIFDTECDILPEGIKVRGRIAVFDIDNNLIEFAWSNYKDNTKEAFNEAYDLYISDLAEAAKR